MQPKTWERFAKCGIRALESATEVFCTFHGRPRLAQDVAEGFETKPDAGRDVAIVLQGPLVLESNFTAQTVHLYRRLFPAAAVIVSTWKGLRPDVRAQLEEGGAVVVENDDPEWPGQQNINRQIVSSAAGVKKAETLGCRYTLKTRTDQRLYSPRALDALAAIVEAFPLKDRTLRQEGRIVGPSLDTFRYRMYGLSDILSFGYTQDIALYWRPVLDEGRFGQRELDDASRILGRFARLRLCEVFLMTRFLETLGYPLQWTLADSWRAFGRHFGIVNAASLDLFWFKGVRKEYRWRGYSSKELLMEEITFEDWLVMYLERREPEPPE